MVEKQIATEYRADKPFLYLGSNLATFSHVPGTHNMLQNHSIKHLKAAPTCFEFFAVSWLSLFFFLL
jgi:hypothetical protein